MANTKWTLDPLHSELGFKIKHLMITNISGTLRNFQAEMKTVGQDLTTAQISLTAEMASITTNNEQRDQHLLNADFFDTEKYPQLIFTSTKIEKNDDADFTVHGELTMKGVTKSVQLNVEYSGVTKDPWGSERAGFTVAGKIKRSEWGVTFNSVLETGGVALSEEVRIFGELQLTKEAIAVAV